jgi:hypothetical protein
MNEFDLVIRGGTVVTATDTLRADIGSVTAKSPPSPTSSGRGTRPSMPVGCWSCQVALIAMFTSLNTPQADPLWRMVLRLGRAPQLLAATRL